MSKFKNMNKRRVPDPLTGGTQDIYTTQDGTFMMCLPDRAVLCNPSKVDYDIKSIKNENGIRVWSWGVPNTTEDAEYEIIQPKQLT